MFEKVGVFQEIFSNFVEPDDCALGVQVSENKKAKLCTSFMFLFM